jgi:hypothetical protein
VDSRIGGDEDGCFEDVRLANERKRIEVVVYNGRSLSFYTKQPTRQVHVCFRREAKSHESG